MICKKDGRSGWTIGQLEKKKKNMFLPNQSFSFCFYCCWINQFYNVWVWFKHQFPVKQLKTGSKSCLFCKYFLECVMKLEHRNFLYISHPLSTKQNMRNIFFLECMEKYIPWQNYLIHFPGSFYIGHLYFSAAIAWILYGPL